MKNKNILKEEQLFEKIIPYCSENFVTIPLWEEGDLRPNLNIWQVPQGNTPSDCYNSYNKIINSIYEFFVDTGFDYEIEDDFSFEDRLLPCNMKNSFNIKIYQIGYILDEDIIPNYSIIELMKIAVDLLDYLKSEDRK